MKTQQFTFIKDWWDILKELPAGTRDEIICATCSLVFEGTEPEVSPEAVGVFLVIKNRMNNEANRSKQISERRAAAGRMGGLEKAKRSKSWQNVAKLANASKELETSDLVANASFATNNPPYNPPIYSTSSSSSSSSASACEGKAKLKKWIIEAAIDKQTELVVFRKMQELTETGRLNYKQKSLDELIDQFYDFDFRVREYCERGYRTDALSHFQNWLPSYLTKKITEANNTKAIEHDNRTDQNQQNATTSSLSGASYFND